MQNQSIKEIVNRSYYIKLSDPFQQKGLTSQVAQW